MKSSAKFWYFTGTERGDASLPFALAVTALSIVSVGAMIDRSVSQGQAAKKIDQSEQSAQAPMNSAILAKSLLTVPDGSRWNTASLKDSNALMPSLYPDPYVSSQEVLNGQVGQTAWKVFNPPGESDPWTQTSEDSSLGKVTLFTTDSGKVLPATFSSIFSKGSSGRLAVSDLSSLTRKSIKASFALQNCDNNGGTVSSWTGIYCANATLKDLATNKETRVALGALDVPPAPTCNGITAPATLSVGSSDTFTVQTSGVVVGYTLRVSTTVNGQPQNIIEPVPTGTIFTAANRVVGSADLGPFTIDLTPYNSAQIPGGTSVNIDVTLNGVGGTVTQCQTKVINTSGPSCSLKLFDTVRPGNDTPQNEITKPHQNRHLWLYYYVNNGGPQYSSRIQFADMTNLTAPYGGDANGLIMPGTSGGPWGVMVTAQGNAAGVYGAAGRIWKGGKVVATCSIQGQMYGQWIRTYAQDCNNVCNGRGMAKRQDWNRMACASGEQWLSRPFAASLAGTNNESLYNNFLAAMAVISGAYTLWGVPPDMDEMQVKWPQLGKKTISEGQWCYWTNQVNTLAGCNGLSDEQLVVPACQTLDWDETDKTIACYCGK